MNKEMEIINISDHAYMRAKERLSWSNSALENTVHRAYISGINRNDTSGRLNQYLLKLIKAQGYGDIQVRIYSDAVFIFSNQKLITIYSLPANLRMVAHKIIKSKVPF